MSVKCLFSIKPPARRCRTGRCTCGADSRPAWVACHRPRRHPGHRVIDKKHSTDIDARLAVRVTAYTDARTRLVDSTSGKGSVLNDNPASAKILGEVPDNLTMELFLWSEVRTKGGSMLDISAAQRLGTDGYCSPCDVSQLDSRITGLQCGG